MATNEAVTLPGPTLDVPAPPLRKGEREYRAFQRLHPQLLPTYRDQYVAIHEEQVVDHDTDDIALILRVHARYGYVPVYVGLVTAAPLVPIRIPHHRLYRPGEAT